MISKAYFILGKHPSERSGGDVTLTKLVMNIASEAYSVSAVAFVESDEYLGRRGQIYGIKKPPKNVLHILCDSIRSGRSTIHARFDSSALRNHLSSIDAGKFVAEHSYMAEAAISSENCANSLWINTHVSEADVLRSTQTVRSLEYRAVLRDEIRTAKAAQAVGCFDRNELERYRTRGVSWVRPLDITFPPADQVDIGQTPQHLLFIGDQTWRPNFVAAQNLLRLWPAIKQRVPGARLSIAGKQSQQGLGPTPDGVDVLGFVDSLEPLLLSSRALVAPVDTGGGVRVKILETSARGIPLVGTSAAIGSLDEALDLRAFDEPTDFVERCVQLLQDPREASHEGDALYSRNLERWKNRVPHTSVANWLQSSGPTPQFDRKA